MRIGSIRVSKHEQNEALQRDALKEAGCEKYFSDTMTGSRLEQLLAFMRSGDTVIVWKLDRLERLLKDLIETLNLLNNREVNFVSPTEHIDTTTPGGKLIFHLMGALAVFERDLIRESTNAGLAAARARGRVGGRPRKLSRLGKVALAQRLFADKKHSIDDICSTLGISRSTLYHYVREPKKVSDRPE
jgi:DNA invertase Pin-like site-specific DNA recombinase